MVIRNAEEKNKTMEEKSKNQSNGKINRFFKRAAAWEISDSDADSDIESHQTETVTLMNPTADTLDHGICDHAVQEDLKSCLSASEPASPQQVATSSPSQNIMKRIPADIKACQARAESRKLKREIRKTEKERRKAQEVLEKQRRREAFDTLKLLRPDQCLKYMTVCIDPGLLEDPGSDALMKAFDSLECNYYIEPQEVPCSITWRRNTPNGFSSVDDTLVKSEEENEVVLLVDPRDFLKRLLSVTQSLREAPSGNRPDLSQLLPLDCLEGPSLKSYSLAVIGLCAYTWYDSHQDKQSALTPEEQSRHKDLRFQLSPELSMTQQELEEGLVVLQLWGNTEVLFLDTWHELSQHVSALTKAIAKRPYKKQLKTQLFSFCTDGGWPSSIRVEKDGTGLKQLWKRQIKQFNRVSPVVAGAIAAAYPSPSLLLQAYEECSTEKDRFLLLSDIRVKAEDNRRERRIGTDLSRRVYLFITSTNPDLVLDLG
uniref:Essential meiotic structure-specific endonuclease subunit 2 n=1 Tax=Pelodiscus sinensis TaxID=13735 RepID=K7F6K3_PELSI|nr:probable crossover junction endonuclease EME2 [Pelodiscus sinensis]XP_006130105.1 probable crossover junction endonuclease EME2 [Pelodiscus sinensis]XP_014432512.1 probable crossover junction endonuclease EME2 [Pelodiscus sinensis]|eukprot:XP_006130104.1 probable crossover junction endonuclease EME2 [Pelodiscus sinensis]